MKYKTMDANNAVASVAYNFSEICGIYPITPASPMAELVDKMTKDNVNFFGNKVKVVEMQSEAGAIGLVHGALQAGSLATTFTASQGLLLMIPSLYKVAGEMLPLVIHVAARSISTLALSIFGDHQDIYATRMSGVCMLCSNNPIEAYHLANVAHLAAIKSSLPFIHFFDGFRTRHEINKIRLINNDKIKELIDKKSLNDFRAKAINPERPNTRGTAQNEDTYFQCMEVRNKFYEEAILDVCYYMDKVNKICKTNYKPFNYYGADNPDTIIIAMGSVCDTIHETVSYLNDKYNKKYGVISVHLYRPFSNKHLLSKIPNSVKNIVVLDRSKEAGSNGEALYLDVCSALKDMNVNIYGGRYGLSSKNTTPAHIKAIFDYVEEGKIHNNFTIGINDDVTNLSLNFDKNFVIPSDLDEYLFYGYGSDGMVSTSKDVLKIIGDNTNKYVQGYFQYDSKKSGGVTRSYLRIGNEEFQKPYYPLNPKLVVVSKDSYMYRYDILDNVCDNGILLLNTNLNEKEIVASLPDKVKYLLATKNIRFYIIDANKIVNEVGLKNKISTCMEIAIFKLINIIKIDKVKAIMKAQNKHRFLSKGEKIIEINNVIVDKALDYLVEIKVEEKWKDLSYKDVVYKNNEEIINYLKGDDLPVSAFLKNKEGIYEGGNTKYEKRNITEVVPFWKKENCIQCNQCAFVCPHAVIRSFLTESKDNSIKAVLPKSDLDVNYKIAISYEDCTGCGLCVNACPGKMGNKALCLINYDKSKCRQEDFDNLVNNNLNGNYNYDVKNVKNIMFNRPKFEFSGACAGCGETPYIKNLTQYVGDGLVIANATGCSSIYGASSPSTPYSVAWASSLFEDNSEYGLGIEISYQKKRDDLREYLMNAKFSRKNKELVKKLLDNYNDYNICKYVYDNLDYDKYLEENKDYILPKTVFVIGGDGFAYDIGFGGLDHVLSTDNDINILVLDTEVYSNTGGQASKSTSLGAIASFASSGKTNYKKDLARMAMCYPNVYVACVNIGYNKEQYLKVLGEAINHKGPSLIIAYAPCIEHGIKKGMGTDLENASLATKCGYFLTFRYDPVTLNFTLDSKNVDFNLYEEFLGSQNRYNVIENKELLQKQKVWAKNRYDYYKKLEEEKKCK